MRIIRELKAEELNEYVDIISNAYPGFACNSPEEKEALCQRMVERQKEEPVGCYGLFEKGSMLGGMRLHDFQMNLRSRLVPAGGIGMVAVALLHKKEKVCYEMLQFFLKHYKERGAPLALLYPFRPDFYKKMGFGFGTKINRYEILPAALPIAAPKEHLRFLKGDDAPALYHCYQRVFKKTNGLLVKSRYSINTLFKNPKERIVGYFDSDELRGYMHFILQRGATDNFLDNDLLIKEFVYEDPVVLKAMLAFLGSQVDQVKRVILFTHDEDFHHLLSDPRNSSGSILHPTYHECNLAGVGLMYRVLDMANLFRWLDKTPNNIDCRLKITVTDSFLPENTTSTYLKVEGGSITPTEKSAHDTAISLDIATLSSLAVGAVTCKTLVRLGLIEVNPLTHTEKVDSIFAPVDKPVCLTLF